MLRQRRFWEEEHDAPIFTRNAGCFKWGGDNTTAYERTSHWLERAGVDTSEPCPIPLDDNDDQEAGKELPRIVVADAERTFVAPDRRQSFAKLLAALHTAFGDYHQGLGYVVAFLSLTMETESVIRLVHRLHTSSRFIPGYWHAAPDAFVRDARVFGRLLERYFPEVHAKLLAGGVLPESYAQKWFCGLAIHVLTLDAVFGLVEGVMDHGRTFLFQFALSLVEHIADRILETPPTNVSRLYALLRLDASEFPDGYRDGEFFTDIVAKAAAYDLGDEDLPAMQEEEEERVRAYLERVRAQERENSDDEIVFSDEEEEEEEEGKST